MKYSYNVNPDRQGGLARFQKRVLLITIAVLFAIAAVLGILYFKERNTTVDIRGQLQQRILNDVSRAIDAIPTESSVNSLTASKVGTLKGYIAAVDEMNQIAISLYGEGGRILSQESVDRLYADLDEYYRLLQQSTISTITVRTNLNTHLTTIRDELRK